MQLKIKPKKCKFCGEKYTPKYLSTEPCSNYECRLKLLEVKKVKIDKKVTAIRKKAQKEAKNAFVDYKKKLQSKVQEIVRLIDYRQVCLARKYIPKQAHAGHLFSRQSAPNMSLNLHGMFLQSAQSNHFQNEDGLLKDGLKETFGNEYYDFINSLHATPTLKLDYEPLYRNACKIANRLKKEQKKLTTEERIEQRNQINIELGIYPVEYCVFKHF